MIKRIFKYLGLTIAVLAVVGLSSALLYRRYLQQKLAEQRAIHSPNGIHSLEAVRIGGIDQWILVRGQDVNNPILLFIHGGPGIAFIPISGSFQKSWEMHFTVVQWDQRGAGKTYSTNDRELQRKTMKITQMEHDTLDVVNYLRARFNRNKIFVVGHSWGSILGLWLAHEHPDLRYAYVGVGQVIDMEQNDALAYKDVLQQARTLHNVQAAQALEAIGPFHPPPSLASKEGTIARHWEEQLLGPPAGPGAFTDPHRLISGLLSDPSYSLADDYGFIRGLSFSMSIFAPQLSQVNLNQMGPDFHVPILFFEGTRDPYCRPSLVWDYSRRIKAPHVEFIWFDSSGHFPFFEEQQKFSEELVGRVLPLAT